jgi:flagellar basal body-associated protein FliL
MDIVDESKKTSPGLELDKFDLANLIRPQITEKKVQKKDEVKEKSGIKFPYLNSVNVNIALIIGAIVLSITLVSLLWDQRVINLPFIESAPAPQISKRIVSVGPMMSTWGKDEHIKMTVLIECKNQKLKGEVARLNGRIQSNIMLMLNDPKVKRLLRQGDFKALKPLIRKEVERLIKNSGIEDVYFSQINLY